MQDYAYALQYLNHVCHAIDCSLRFYRDANFYYRRLRHHLIHSTHVNVSFLCICHPPVANRKRQRIEEIQILPSAMSIHALTHTCKFCSDTQTTKLNIMILPHGATHTFFCSAFCPTIQYAESRNNTQWIEPQCVICRMSFSTHLSKYTFYTHINFTFIQAIECVSISSTQNVYVNIKCGMDEHVKHNVQCLQICDFDNVSYFGMMVMVNFLPNAQMRTLYRTLSSVDCVYPNFKQKEKALDLRLFF